MKTSSTGIALIQAFESCLKPAGVVTIGWGTTAADVPSLAEGEVWSRDKCDDVFIASLAKYEASFAVTAWPEGVRVDLALANGSGTHWHQTGSIWVDDPDLGPMEQPVLEAVPGFHVDLLWSDGTPPDFGAARIEPATPSQVFAM